MSKTKKIPYGNDPADTEVTMLTQTNFAKNVLRVEETVIVPRSVADRWVQRGIAQMGSAPPDEEDPGENANANGNKEKAKLPSAAGLLGKK